MSKYFNTSGNCTPPRHYMVNIENRLIKIKSMIDRGEYFTINRARQYGKTTTLKALEGYLQNDYIVLSLDFQMLTHSDFETEDSFTAALADAVLRKPAFSNSASDSIAAHLRKFAERQKERIRLAGLFDCFSSWCRKTVKPVVLMIDEVDSAANNQVFLDFLSQLRACYIGRDETAVFQSVILAGVYDVKNLKSKFVSDGDHKKNSPWNIAADFTVDMSFTAEDIAGMLKEYEADYHTGMDVKEAACMIYDYTSGYPFLVSRICKLVDEQVAERQGYPDRKSAWTKSGILEAIKILIAEKNTLFDSLAGKLTDYPELRNMLYSLLFTGNSIPYSSLNEAINEAEMFGFIKNREGSVGISNRIFESVLYNLFLSEEAMGSKMYLIASQDRNQFIRNGHLDMKLVLEKFVCHFTDLYGGKTESFLEETGRRYFLLYLKPIINGKGNYYIEAQTRDMGRTDVVVDYGGEQFVIELKLWRGNAYHERGETQLLEYLEYYHLKEGYMLSFNFNKNKKIGVKKLHVGGKLLIEAVV